jgi:hypothetical protein
MSGSHVLLTTGQQQPSRTFSIIAPWLNLVGRYRLFGEHIASIFRIKLSQSEKMTWLLLAPMIEAVGFPENLVTTPKTKTRCHGREDNNIKIQKRYSFLLMTYPPTIQGFFFLPRGPKCRNYTNGQFNDSLLEGRATASSYILKNNQPTHLNILPSSKDRRNF